jgi:preprotein translocase subunit SecA
MDYLREGIHLRGFAQIDPLVAYKNEGFTMFEQLMNSIWEEFARVIYHVQVNIEAPPVEEPPPELAEVAYSGGTQDQPSALYDAQRAEAAAATGGAVGTAAADAATAGAATGPGAALDAQAGDGVNPATKVKSDREKIGRNDPCWCGSGKKYKKCHGA